MHTAGFIFNHSMIRVKDAAASLHFYTEILGMTLLRRADYEQGQFTLYFLAHVQAGETPPSEDEALKKWIARRPAVLELTHNWGTEKEADFAYHNGNSEPRGFGHLCISVPDLAAAVAWFDAQRVPFQKRLEDGSMRDIAFIKDPDGYWIEIIQY